MAEIHTLILKSDSSEIKESHEELDKLSASANKADKSTDNLGKTSSNTATSLKTMAGVLATVAAGLAIDKMVEYSDTWTLINSRLLVASNSTLEYVTAQRQLFDIAQETRQGLEQTVDLYSRMARATGELGISQQDLFDVTETVNKALIVSGASTQEASSAITQLGQALASGVLRGEEFNSISENGSRIAEALAASLGVTRGELRAMAEQGKLTSQIVIEAILKQKNTIDTEFGKMGMTISQAGTHASNTFMKLVGRISEVTGAGQGAADTITRLSNLIASYSDTIALWAGRISRFMQLAGIGIAQIGNGIYYAWLTIKNKVLTVVEDLINTVMAHIIRANNELAGTFLGEMVGIEEKTFNKITLAAKGAAAEIESVRKSIVNLGFESQMITNEMISGKFPMPKISAGADKNTTGGATGGAGSGAVATKTASSVADKVSEYDNYIKEMQGKADQLLEAMYPYEALVTKWEDQQKLLTELYELGMVNNTQRKDGMLKAEEDYQNAVTQLWQQGFKTREVFAAMSAKNQTQTVLTEMINMTQGMATQNKVMFEINKMASAAQVVLQTYEAASNAYTWGTAIGGPVVGATMAAIAVAAQVAKVQSIMSTSFGATSASGVAPSQIGESATIVANTSTQQETQKTVAPQEIVLNLGKEDFVLSSTSLRSLIEQIDEQAGDMGYKLRIT